MKQFLLDSFDGKKIGINVWDEVVSPKGCVMISHGMAEHPDRYDDFAKYLNGRGYIVAADDHRGHRRTAEGGINGMVDGDSWNQTVKDMEMLCVYLKETYGLKVALLGHSYGSFLSQYFIERSSSEIVGAVLSGTAYMKGALTQLGRTITACQKKFIGAKKYGKLINKLSFGAYNKPFEGEGIENAWLSRNLDEVKKYNDDVDCGYVLCIGYYHAFLKGVNQLYKKAAKTISPEFKIMIAVGSEDPVSNRAVLATKLNNFYLGLGLKPTFKVYPEARHEILNETNKDEVYEDIANFIDTLF